MAVADANSGLVGKAGLLKAKYTVNFDRVSTSINSSTSGFVVDVAYSIFYVGSSSTTVFPS